MQTLWRTLGYALRQFRRSPAITLTAVLTLALGIGPATAVYAVFRQVLLREMPVHNPGELVLLRDQSAFNTGWTSTHGGSVENYFAYPAIEALRKVEPLLAGEAPAQVTLLSGSTAERVNAQLVTGNYFNVLGTRPLLGRLLNEQDDRLHAGNPVAVLSASYWKSAFGASPAVLNRVVLLNGQPYTVVGVAADASLMDARPAAVFAPLATHVALKVGQPDSLEDPFARFILAIGRIPSGQARPAAAALNTAWWNWRRDVLAARGNKISDKRGWMRTHLAVESGARGVSVLAQNFGTPVMALQAMTALLLVVCCANLANLLLAQAARQRGQQAVRLALGASRARLTAEAMAQACLLGCGGAALGLPLGWACLRLLAHSLAAESSTRLAVEAPFAWPVVLFAVGAGIVTSVLFSAGPAAAAARVQPADVLRRASGVVGGSAARLQRVLVSGAIAFSFLLLLASALVGWNLWKQSTAQLGFSTKNLLTFRVDESSVGGTPARVDQVYSELLNEAQQHGGVVSAAYSEMGLLAGNEMSANLSIEGRANRLNDPSGQKDYISPDFFRTLGIPLLRGRSFSDSDRAGSEQVAIVNEKFVQTFFDGDAARAIGAHFDFGAGDHMRYEKRIVGVIPSTYTDSPAQAPKVPLVYMPYKQQYTPNLPPTAQFAAIFYIRTAGDPARLAGDMRAIVHRIDPKLPVLDLRTMQEQWSADIADTRLLALLSSALGALSALLAAVGLYGVLSYQVATRTREIGLRIAVGASRARVVTLVLKQMLRLTVWGLGWGGVLAWCCARLLHSQIADLVAAPVLLYIAAGLLLLLTAAAAALAPATRAAHIDPIEALRAECT